MKYQEYIEEGLQIVDSEGIPFTTREENESHWTELMYPTEVKIPEDLDNEDAWEYLAMVEEHARGYRKMQLDKLHQVSDKYQYTPDEIDFMIKLETELSR